MNPVDREVSKQRQLRNGIKTYGQLIVDLLHSNIIERDVLYLRREHERLLSLSCCCSCPGMMMLPLLWDGWMFVGDQNNAKCAL